MPIWKASPLQKEEGLYGSVLQAVPALAGEGPKPVLGGSGMLCLPKFSTWADLPSRQHSNPPGHKLHCIYPEGKISPAVLQRDKPFAVVTHPHILCCPFPSPFASIGLS